MEGELKTRVERKEDSRWTVDIEMMGELATPWPDKQTLSGGSMENPEGDIIDVPFIDKTLTLEGKYRHPITRQLIWSTI